MKSLQSIRGMNDILPDQTPLWQYLEQQVARILGSYGYREIRFPIVEPTALFRRAIGEVTDIVEKEMYTFDDRNGDSLTLRPEGTASCVRACQQAGLLFNQVQRVWYMGPMFRHERPQKGRQRQFHQIGAEAFGMAGPDIDAELILLTVRLWKNLGVLDALTLELNSIGTPADRARYREALVAWLEVRKEQLDEDSKRRLHTNPLRILDSKNPDMIALLQDAPMLAAYLSPECRTEFDALQARLTDAGVAFVVNPRLVRGLDYYSKSVFEWTTDRLGAQGTVCAGGRYDGLVEQLGGRPTPAVGFAMGIERLCLLLEACDAIPDQLARDSAPHVFLAASGAEAEYQAQQLAEQLRDALPGLRLLCHCGGGSFKSQFKRADRSGAPLALVLGETELAAGQVQLKWLRDGEAEQEAVELTDLPARLAEILSADIAVTSLQPARA